MIQGWKDSKLADIADVVTGKTPLTANREYYSGTVPFACPGDIGNTKYIYETEKKLSEEGAKFAPLIPAGSTLFTCIGIIGKTGIAKKELRTNQQINSIIPKSINGEFLYYVLGYMKSRIERLAGFQVMPIVTKREFENVIVLHPKELEEQEKIANVLMHWDSAIEKTEQLIQAKKKQFEWLAYNLITKSGFERVKLGEVIKENTERKRNSSISLVLSVTNNRGFVPIEEQFQRNVSSKNLSNYKIVYKGQYAYNPARINVGSIARLDKWEDCLVSPIYVCFSLDEEKIHNDYFLHWLKSGETKQRIKNSTQGSVRQSLNFQDFSSIAIPLPSIEKQEKIAGILNTAQQEIQLLEQLAEKYRIQKRGLMQKLLTGTWRI